MFCSTIIPTINRPTLTRAVESVLTQNLKDDRFEIIVVNDSGRPLTGFSWLDSSQVRIIDTYHRERSIARNTGAAISSGRYLHFLDDDDWLLPGAYSTFYDTARDNNVEIMYGGFVFVDKNGVILEENTPDEAGNLLVRIAAGEWLPLQATLIRAAAFFNTRGFEPWLIPYQDNDLMMQLALTKEFNLIQQQVASIVRDFDRSTTDYGKLTENIQWSREKLLNNPKAYSRLRQSAKERPLKSSYWQGRITFLYLLSAIRNIPKKRFSKVLSRLFFSVVNILLSGSALFDPSFWKGVIRSHTTQGFMRSDGILK